MNSLNITLNRDSQNLIVNCDKIIFKENGIEIILSGDMNYNGFKKIVINGVTFDRAKVRDDRDDYFLKCQLGL